MIGDRGQSHVFKEHAPLSMRRDVQKMNRAQPIAKHTVVFAMSQRNIPDLERILWDVSDPTSENYGKHWTRAEVGAFTSNPAATKAVLEYLSTVKEVTIDHRTLYDEYITATGPVEVWEALLKTEFNVYAVKEAFSGLLLKAMSVTRKCVHSFAPSHTHCHLSCLSMSPQCSTPSSSLSCEDKREMMSSKPSKQRIVSPALYLDT